MAVRAGRNRQHESRVRNDGGCDLCSTSVDLRPTLVCPLVNHLVGFGASRCCTSFLLILLVVPQSTASLMMMLVGGVNLSQNLVDLGKQLLEACKNGNTEEVKSLMQSGAPFSTDWLGSSPLHFAAQYGHSDTIEVLLRAGVSRDTRTKVDRTPLHIAAQEGHLDIVQLLVMHGADIDAKDLLRMTPLHWAVERGYTDIVEALLSNGADPDTENKFDKTAIDIAYDMGRTEMVPLLQVSSF